MCIVGSLFFVALCGALLYLSDTDCPPTSPTTHPAEPPMIDTSPRLLPYCVHYHFMQNLLHTIPAPPEPEFTPYIPALSPQNAPGITSPFTEDCLLPPVEEEEISGDEPEDGIPEIPCNEYP